MNHPQREEWVPFIFDEAPQDTQKRLRDHLKVCPTCAQEVAGWRRSLRRLDGWLLPDAPAKAQERAHARVFVQPVFKWAIAAMIVLGLGFAGGSLSSSGKTADMRALIEAAVSSRLQAQMDAALTQARTENANALRDAELRLTQTSVSERERLWRAFLQVLGNARAEDAKTLQAAFRDLQQRDNAEFVALRKDLETLASATDDEIRAARLKLFELASATPP